MVMVMVWRWCGDKRGGRVEIVERWRAGGGDRGVDVEIVAP